MATPLALASPKVSAQFRVLVDQPGAIPKLASEHFAIADLVRDLMQRDQGDAVAAPLPTGGEGTGSAGLADPSQYINQNNFISIDPNLVYVELGPTVTKGANASTGNAAVLGGFWMRPRVVPKNFVIAPGKSGDPVGPTSLGTIRWKVLAPTVASGDTSKWETMGPLLGSGNTRVCYTEQLPDKTASIQTIDMIPANQQFAIYLHWLQIATGQTGRAALRFAWGSNTWSIVWRAGTEPTLERSVKGAWTVVALLDGGSGALNGDTLLSVVRVGGRLVIQINDHVWNYTDTRKDENGVPQPVNATWPAGSWNVNCFGVQATIGGGYALHTDTKGKAFKDLPVRRKVPRSLRTSGGVVTGATGGWNSASTKTSASGTADYTGVDCTWLCSASPDGIEAPFLDRVLMRLEGALAPANNTQLDITRAFLKARERSASPETQISGADWSMELDRNILAMLDPNWFLKLRDKSPITFEVRYKLADGTFTPWVMRLDGYIADDSRVIQRFGEPVMSITLRDKIWRYTKPNSIIDQRYSPMDFLWAQSKKPMYGGDCVKEIIRIEQGPAEAARLNGNGNPLEFFVDGHAPLIDGLSDAAGYMQAGYLMLFKPPSSPGFIFPLPGHDKSAQDWIHQFAEMEYAVFYYGHITPPGGTSPSGAMVPIYGDWRQIIANRPTWRIADNAYAPGDVDFLLLSLETKRRGDANFNRCLTLLNPPGVQDNQITRTAIFMQEARLPPGDANSQENGWVTTYVQDFSNLASAPAWPLVQMKMQEWASAFVSLLAGVDQQFPHLTIIGDERIGWGDKCQVVMSTQGAPTGSLRGDVSDLTAGVDHNLYTNASPVTLRILRVENEYNNTVGGLDRFKSNLFCYPLSSIGDLGS